MKSDVSEKLLILVKEKWYPMKKNDKSWAELTALAIHLNETNLLKDFKAKFFIADHDEIYLDGNSLGRMPLESQRKLAGIIENQWRLGA